MTVNPPTASEPLSGTTPEGDAHDEHIGALLRQTRETGRIALAAAAGALRIRLPYLQAIEDGDYQRLPGVVYAVGFVRTYAEYLGLDGEEAVRRFKREAQGLDSQPDLSYPTPIAERSIPGGRILVTALVLAICGYGLWYYEAGGGRSQPDIVAEVPPALVQSPDAGAADPLTSPNEARASVPAPPQSAAPRPRAATETKVATAAPAPAPAPLPEPALRTADAPVAGMSSGPASRAPAAPPSPAAPAAAAPAEASDSAAPAPAVPDATPEQVALAAPPAPPPPKPDVPGPSHVSSHVYGTTDGQVRIVVRITDDCWIEVREADQSLRFSKLLHAGDVYRVADLPGLTLKTGNSNGLQIVVDGKPVNIPPVDSRVFSIALDPARLASGDAALPAEIHPVAVQRRTD